MTEPEISMSEIQRDHTHIIRLPKGRLMEIEWLDSYVNAVRVVGFESDADYFADEQYRKAGLEPLLRSFFGRIPMEDV